MLEVELDSHLTTKSAKGPRPATRATGITPKRCLLPSGRIQDRRAQGQGRALRPHDSAQTGQHGLRHRERDHIPLRQGHQEDRLYRRRPAQGRQEGSPRPFWMSVLTDIKACGTEDMLITATDNLNGFNDTIKNL